MVNPSEKLAESLDALEALQRKGSVAIRSRDLSRRHRERLLENGFLQEVMKGWYIPGRPEETRGESTSWFASFWSFCAAYLETRFEDQWSLSPEQSITLHIGNWSVPQQLLVRAPKARNKVTPLAHGTSLFESRASIPEKSEGETINGLRVFKQPAGLTSAGPAFFRHSKNEARTALATITDASKLLSVLLEGGHSTVAGRLAGAFRNIGRDRIADDILKSMKSAGYNVRESDPFAEQYPALLTDKAQSPHINRMQLMWQDMRKDVINEFVITSEPGKDIDKYLRIVDENYVTDAYHSLSIEGYRVSRELIEHVRSGDWNPDNNEADREQRDALAARGYYEAFQIVKSSVRKVLEGQNPGDVADIDHGDWYRALFSPGVQAGILKPADLAGYRNDQVFIRHSTYVPPRHDAVRKLMPGFFELLRDEESAPVRIVLGHYFFVYIHPYMDGNGRIGRFLMNVMMAAGGYPWTIIPVERRGEYMAALDAVCTDSDIRPFTRFITSLIK
ncbi:MAG: Fic family protein [Gammaproteobacteria bacterium]